MCDDNFAGTIAADFSLPVIPPLMHYAPNLNCTFTFTPGLFGTLIILRTLSVSKPDDYFEIYDQEKGKPHLVGNFTGDFSNDGADECLQFFASRDVITAHFVSDASSSFQYGIRGVYELLHYYSSASVRGSKSFIFPFIAYTHRYGYYERSVSACHLCTIELKISQNANLIVIYDGKDAFSPELGRVRLEEATPLVFRSSGNTLFVKALNEMNYEVDTVGNFIEISPAKFQCGSEILILISNKTLKEMKYQRGNMLVASSMPVLKYDSASIKRECIDRYTPEIGQHYLKFQRRDCGSIKSNKTHIIFTYVVRKVTTTQPNDVVRMESEASINFICAFPKSNRVDLLAYGHDRADHQLKPVEQDTFRTEFNYYDSVIYSNPVDAPLVVEIPNFVFFAIKLYAPSDQFLEVEQCWVTHSHNYRRSNSRHYVIVQSCASDDQYDGESAVAITGNRASQKVKIKFRSFAWKVTASPRVYLFCDVSVCDSSIDPTCAKKPTCPPSSNSRIKHDRKRKIVELGAIIMHKKGEKMENTCKQSNGGCDRFCSDNGIDVVCSCLEEERLLDDEKSCRGLAEERWMVHAAGIVIVSFLLIFAFIATVVAAMNIKRQQAFVLKS